MISEKGGKFKKYDECQVLPVVEELGQVLGRAREERGLDCCWVWSLVSLARKEQDLLLFLSDETVAYMLASMSKNQSMIASGNTISVTVSIQILITIFITWSVVPS